MPAPRRTARLSWLAPLLSWILVASLVLASACTDPEVIEWPDDETGFDDHTLGEVSDVEQFLALATTDDNGTSALKFVILGFGGKREYLRVLDSKFYAMHDEWYWYRLFNGQRVPGSLEQPREQGHFATVAEIVEWSRGQARLPYGMRWVGDRLYSDYFYEIALHRERRAFGIGTLVHVPAREREPIRPEIWAFELEYTDLADADDLARFFALLRAGLPAAIGDQLHFIARSPHQDRLVAELRGRKHPLTAKLLTYAELAVPGEIEVYNPGLIAGRLRKVPRDPVRAAALFAEADEDAILLMPAVPDELPSGRGLITATPQTPLAHVNLLARNRGIPNAYLGGSYDDPNLDQLSRVHAPVVVLAEADTLRIEPISEEEYARYLGLVRQRPPELVRIDVDALAWTMSLDSLSVDAMPELRPAIGGKAAGFLALLEAKPQRPALHRPSPAIAITVRAYAQHLAPLRATIGTVLQDPRFTADARLRLLMLEGRKAFAEQFPGERQVAWLAELERDHPPERADRDPIAWLLRADGIQKAIRDQPIDGTAAAAIEQTLRTSFAELAPTQGLRFRSSSSIEDIEGFNGAGLYASNTGFLAPELQADEKDKKHDFAWALRKTWASYWTFPAFEERRLAGIDHLAGHMGVLVHPRFDDAIEQANGVVTLGWSPARGDRPETSVMLVNVQYGELSVANPPNDEGRVVRPELVRVTRRGTEVSIERLAASTEVPQGQVVLDDARLRELLAVCERVAARWHAVENAPLPPTQQRFSTTLDLEFRVVAPGWPARADGRIEPERLIVKQARSLEPGVPAGGESLVQQPIPRDLLTRATRVDRWQCQAGRARVDVLEVVVDPLAHLDAELSNQPFVARLRLDGREPVPDADLAHPEFASVAHPGLAQGRPWALELGLTAQASGELGIERIVLDGGLMRVFGSEGRVLLEEPAPCTRQVLLDSPQAFLRALLERGR
ncbi:PEP/pyruvate-binding domain-containing protein [Nannocystaceae bacterium ST9]